MIYILSDTHFEDKWLDWKLEVFNKVLSEVREGDEVLILGDLFNSKKESYNCILRVKEALESCLGEVIILRGNHDASRNLDEISAFDFLQAICDKCNFISDTRLETGALFLPHVPTQETFEDCILANDVRHGSVLFTHANLNNIFAAEKRHSLNLSSEMASKFDSVFLGHEHEPKIEGNVTVVGSLLPVIGPEFLTDKFYLRGEHIYALQQVKSYDKRECVEVHFSELASLNPKTEAEAKVVNVVGEVTLANAKQMLLDFSKFKSETKALLVINSTTSEEFETLDAQSDSMSNFLNQNPLELMGRLLSKEHKQHLQELGHVLI